MGVEKDATLPQADDYWRPSRCFAKVKRNDYAARCAATRDEKTGRMRGCKLEEGGWELDGGDVGACNIG